jgi:hypothetical protein
MSTILTNTGVTFPDSTTQSSAAHTPHVVCKAYITTSPTITTSSSSWALVPIDAATYDNSGSFDTTNHRFVIPNTGYYCVSYLLGVNTTPYNAIYFFGSAIGVNGTPIFSENYFQPYYPPQSYRAKGTAILHFNSGDTISLYVIGYGNASYCGPCCCTLTGYNFQIGPAILDIHQVRF